MQEKADQQDLREKEEFQVSLENQEVEECQVLQDKVAFQGFLEIAELRDLQELQESEDLLVKWVLQDKGDPQGLREGWVHLDKWARLDHQAIPGNVDRQVDKDPQVILELRDLLEDLATEDTTTTLTHTLIMVSL
jgi:hypothetical protein